jgi:hypothetical protein
MAEIAQLLTRNNQEATERRVSPRELTLRMSPYKIQELRESTDISNLPSGTEMERRWGWSVG